MGCCKCEEYKWPDPQPVVWTDEEESKGYCVFHAPRGKKFGLLLGMPTRKISVQEFNKIFFNEVERQHKIGVDPLCILQHVIFPGCIDFKRYIKNNELYSLNLQGAEFFGDVSFRDLTMESVCLDEATFHAKADFSDSKFIEDQSFLRTVFEGNAYFSRTTFESGSVFIASEFGRSAWFSETCFGERALFHSIRADPSQIRMQNISCDSLENLIFSSSEVGMFSFVECRHWPSHFGYESDKETSDKGREELYRAMKHNAAEGHDQVQVSHWHFREKLMQLKQKLANERSSGLLEIVENNETTLRARAWPWLKLAVLPPYWPKRSLLGLYWFFSGFGERYFRALVWLVILALLPFIFSYSPITSGLSLLWPHVPGAQCVNVVIDYLGTSVNATAAMQYIPFTNDIGGKEASGWLKVGQGLWQCLIILQFTLFALAVRNHFRR